MIIAGIQPPGTRESLKISCGNGAGSDAQNPPEGDEKTTHEKSAADETGSAP
jgi:hypothetical protein